MFTKTWMALNDVETLSQNTLEQKNGTIGIALSKKQEPE